MINSKEVKEIMFSLGRICAELPVWTDLRTRPKDTIPGMSSPSADP